MPLSRTVALVALAGALAATSFAHAQRRDVPFVATPDQTVQRMLEMANTGPGDIVYDLGSGDGRIVIAAVRNFGAKKGVGVDIDPIRIKESLVNAEAAGVSDRTEFIEGNLFEVDFSDASVITMYLLSEVNLRLRPRLLSELQPGTRIVSHTFEMGDWEHDETARMHDGRDLFHWVIPARVEGRWAGTIDGEPFTLDLQQKYQRFGGNLHAFGDTTAVRYGELNGPDLRFEAEITQGGQTVPARFEGQVRDENILQGTLTLAGKAQTVEATRAQ